MKYVISAAIDGELPIGSLSSSAASIITFMSCFSKNNDIHLKPTELINLSKEAENKYVGVNYAKVEQSCEVFYKKYKFLFLDIKDNSYEIIKQTVGMKHYEFMII